MSSEIKESNDVESQETILSAIGWWELRRFLFNILLIFGSEISIQLINWIVDLGPGEDAVEPLSLFIFIIFLNMLYTFIWVLEIGTRLHNSMRERIFKAIIYISFGLIFLSPVLNFIRLMIRLIVGF